MSEDTAFSIPSHDPPRLLPHKAGPGPKQPLLLPAGFKEKPPSLCCFMCGRDFGTASLTIHFKACAAKRERKQAELPPAQRKPCPPPPSLPIPTLESTPEEFEEYNAQARALYSGQLPTCTCGRSFSDFLKLQQHQTSCKAHADYLEAQRLKREAEERERLRLIELAESEALRLAEEEAARAAAEAEEIRRRREAEAALRRKREEEARRKAEEERKRREEEKAREDELRRLREEEAARRRKPFLRKGEGKTSNDERLRIETEKALMQKRVRNFEAKGLFESDDVAVDDEDHWLLKQLASAAGADAPVDVKQLMLDPSKGAAELVHKAGKSLKEDLPAASAPPSTGGTDLGVLPAIAERPATVSGSRKPRSSMLSSPSSDKLPSDMSPPKRPGTSSASITSASKLRPIDTPPLAAPSVPKRVSAPSSSDSPPVARPSSSAGDRPVSSPAKAANTEATSTTPPSSTKARRQSSANPATESPSLPACATPTEKRRSHAERLRQTVQQHSPQTPVDEAAAPRVTTSPITTPSTAATALAKFCHNCGVRYTDGAKFCHECGTRRVGT